MAPIPANSAPLGTGFTYQGRLTEGGAPATGIYDLRFAIYDLDTGGSAVGGPVTNSPVGVTNGLFTVTLDFGEGLFEGSARWLEIGVRTNGSPDPHTALLPRQPITPTPYALHAVHAASLMSFANAPLEIKVNGQRALRLEYATDSIFEGINVVGGYSGNVVSNGVVGGTIAGGGGPNFLVNRLGGRFATISGGGGNIASGEFATVGGGRHNWANSGFIGGGIDNVIAATAGGTIGGGMGNSIASNSANATIPGGQTNTATNSAFAAGTRAKANHTGAFVWGDSTDADIASTNDNSMTFRASGGARLFSNTNATAGVFLAPGSGSWSAVSDRAAKENLRPVDSGEVLRRVAALSLATWNYKSQSQTVRHIGPMAQDFHAAFRVGENDTTITTVDADGVALAAIQGLNRKLEDHVKQKDAQIAALEKQNQAVAQRLEELERLLTTLAENAGGK